MIAVAHHPHLAASVAILVFCVLVAAWAFLAAVRLVKLRAEFRPTASRRIPAGPKPASRSSTNALDPQQVAAVQRPRTRATPSNDRHE